MYSQRRLIQGLVLCAAGCAQIIDSEAPYVLHESGTSQSTTGGAGAGGSGGGMGGGPECTLAEHCVNVVENQCTKRACVSNACQEKFLGAESPASAALQQSGDCKVVVCDGFGGTKTVNDDMDSPNDDNGCTTDTCLNGSEVFTKVAIGTNCGVNSFCDAVGQCVGCLLPADCTGSYDFCKQPTCISGVCGISYAADNTALPSNDQNTRDCLISVCDGGGNVVTRIDTTDVPIDGNDCTQDACNADGTPFHPPEPISTVCGDGINETCDGAGNCQKFNGKPCSATIDCLSGYCVDGVCCESACDGTCSACNVSPLTAGTCTMVLLGQEDSNGTIPCSGVFSCDGNGVCKKDNGQPCASVMDCVNGFCVDGYCCDNGCTGTCKGCNVPGALGICKNMPFGSPDNNASLACNGPQVCNGYGSCKLANGQSCSGDSQCASGDCGNGSPKVCVP